LATSRSHFSTSIFAVSTSSTSPACSNWVTKGGFPNDNNLLKLLYIGIQNASKEWKACSVKPFGYDADPELEFDFISVGYRSA
jgi:hypothetical protein